MNSSEAGIDLYCTSCGAAVAHAGASCLSCGALLRVVRVGISEAGIPAVIAPVQRKSGAGWARYWHITAVGLFAVAVLSTIGAYAYSTTGSSAPAVRPTAIVLGDQSGLAANDLQDARALIAAGKDDLALSKLRLLVQYGPASAEARIELGRLYQRKGAWAEALEQYKLVAAVDGERGLPLLAGCQSQMGLFRDAAESYKRLLEAGGPVDDATRLAYADALAHSGQEDAALAVYKQLDANATDSSSALVARNEKAGDRRKLRKPGPITWIITREPVLPFVASRSILTVAPTAPSVPDTGSGKVDARSARIIESDSAADERMYADAMRIVKGRDIHTLQRSELLHALQLLQNVKRGSQRQNAAAEADRLGREYDQRRSQ